MGHWHPSHLPNDVCWHFKVDLNQVYLVSSGSHLSSDCLPESIARVAPSPDALLAVGYHGDISSAKEMTPECRVSQKPCYCRDEPFLCEGSLLRRCLRRYGIPRWRSDLSNLSFVSVLNRVQK